MSKILKLIFCISIPLVGGALSGIATVEGVLTWYVDLHKPSFNPPNYLFGPVWTTLYFLMGISLFLVVNETSQPEERRRALVIFAIQLFLNFLWSFIFFHYHLLGWALVEILMMWLFIVGLIPALYKVNKWAGLLQLPYLCWVSFASVLNASIYHLN